MRIFDYTQQEIREVIKIKMQEDGLYELEYNNEIVKRKRFEFKILDKVYKCTKGFVLDSCDDNGFTIENEHFIIDKDSLWYTPEDKEYRFIGGEVRLEDEEGRWIELTKEHLEEYFKEI